jgi:hypothetical protein
MRPVSSVPHGMVARVELLHVRGEDSWFRRSDEPFDDRD